MKRRKIKFTSENSTRGKITQIKRSIQQNQFEKIFFTIRITPSSKPPLYTQTYFLGFHSSIPVLSFQPRYTFDTTDSRGRLIYASAKWRLKRWPKLSHWTQQQQSEYSFAPDIQAFTFNCSVPRQSPSFSFEFLIEDTLMKRRKIRPNGRIWWLLVNS